MSITLDYKPEDFNSMLFPFHTIGDKDVFEAFPVLLKYKEFDVILGGIIRSKVIKYIGFCYDKGSPLQKIDDMVKKKVTAAMLAGFEPGKNGRFQKELDDIFKCKNVYTNLMIIRYCRMVRSRTYMVLTVGNEMLYNTIKQLIDNTKNADAKDQQLSLKLLSEATARATEMDKMSLEILSNDNNAALNNLLFAVSDMTEDEYIQLTAEDFADKWTQGHPEIKASLGDGEEEVPVPAS